MLKSCDNCGKEFLTEADLFVYQNRPSGEYYSCGCIEFYCKKKNRKIDPLAEKRVMLQETDY